MELRTHDEPKKDCPNNHRAVGYLNIDNANNNDDLTDCGYRDPARLFDGSLTFYTSRPSGGSGGCPDSICQPDDQSWMIPMFEYYLNN